MIYVSVKTGQSEVLNVRRDLRIILQSQKETYVLDDHFNCMQAK